MLLCTEQGEQHGLINQYPNSNSGDGTEFMSEKVKKELLSQKKEDEKSVKARYINHRGPNERLEANYCKYSGTPVRCYRLIPGHTYELPKGFVNQVNESFLTERSKMDEDRTPVGKSMGTTKIHELVPISF
jgi:hypothetical protein